MENRINIATLLKDCPTGMELDCLMYDNVYFKCIRDHAIYPIVCYTIDSKGEAEEITFNWYGKYALTDTAKCVIFPKGKTTWKGFHRPFKDGDVVATNSGAWLGIITGVEEKGGGMPSYCVIKGDGTFEAYLDVKREWYFSRLATEEERQKLFRVIEANGYKWNDETKNLEKLVEHRFHVGDWVTDGISKCQIHFIDDTYYWYSENCILGSIESVDKQYHIWTINDAKDGDILFHSDSASSGIFIFKEIVQRGTSQKVICHCDYDSEDGFCLGKNHTCCWTDSKILYPATKKRADLLFQKMTEAGYKWNPETKTLKKLTKPRFKIGDRVRGKYTNNIYTIARVTPEGYELTNGQLFTFGAEDCHELVSDKFDISTLIPFESRVLVRDYSHEAWRVSFWGCLINSEHGFKYDTIRGPYKQCIPYKGNEHLLGKMEDCADFYKSW